MKKSHALQGPVNVGVVLTLLVNYLATAGVLNGVTPPETSITIAAYAGVVIVVAAAIVGWFRFAKNAPLDS